MAIQLNITGSNFANDSSRTNVECSTEDLAKPAAEQRIRMSQPQESEALDSLLNSLCTMKRSFSLNELLHSFLEKRNNVE